MQDLDPRLRAALISAVAHVLVAQGGEPTNEQVELQAAHLFKGLVQGPTRAGADWHATWSHLVNHFWGQGLNHSQANQEAYNHFFNTVLEVCSEVESGKWDEEIHSVSTLETCIRNSVSNITQQDES